jgi:hypothetical protein
MCCDIGQHRRDRPSLLSTIQAAKDECIQSLNTWKYHWSDSSVLSTHQEVRRLRRRTRRLHRRQSPLIFHPPSSASLLHLLLALAANHVLLALTPRRLNNRQCRKQNLRRDVSDRFSYRIAHGRVACVEARKDLYPRKDACGRLVAFCKTLPGP